jgi:hypothetical protein
MTPLLIIGSGALVLVLVALVIVRRASSTSDGWTEGIRPYTPLSTLEPIAADIWTVEGPVVAMKIGPLSLPFPTRMVVVRLGSGGLWLWSPTAPTPELLAEIDALGPVEHLVSPNKFHYVAIPAWKRRYPQAITWASPGLRRRANRKVGFAFDADLDDQPPTSWAADVGQLIFRGSRFMEEVVFFHRASSTLILGDLVIALEPERVRPGLRWVFRLVGATWPGRTPRDLQPTYWGRRPRARASYRQMMAWQPQRVIVAHGRCYLDDASAQLARAFAWLGRGS